MSFEMQNEIHETSNSLWSSLGLQPPLGIVPTADQALLESNADKGVLNQVTRLVEDNKNYAVRYPRAMEVKQKLGPAMWQKLERYRQVIITFAILMRKLDRGRCGVLTSGLDLHIPAMQSYVMRTSGSIMEEIFETFHDHQAGTEEMRMTCIREMFRRRPFLWFVYNLYFPVERRMTWEQLAEWAIWSLQQDPLEQPWVVRSLPELEFPLPVPESANEICTRAVVEVLADLFDRFRCVDRDTANMAVGNKAVAIDDSKAMAVDEAMAIDEELAISVLRGFSIQPNGEASASVSMSGTEV